MSEQNGVRLLEKPLAEALAELKPPRWIKQKVRSDLQGTVVEFVQDVTVKGQPIAKGTHALLVAEHWQWEMGVPQHVRLLEVRVLLDGKPTTLHFKPERFESVGREQLSPTGEKVSGCWKCGGTGLHWAVWVDNGICWGCGGRGIVATKESKMNTEKMDDMDQTQDERLEKEAVLRAKAAATRLVEELTTCNVKARLGATVRYGIKVDLEWAGTGVVYANNKNSSTKFVYQMARNYDCQGTKTMLEKAWERATSAKENKMDYGFVDENHKTEEEINKECAEAEAAMANEVDGSEHERRIAQALDAGYHITEILPQDDGFVDEVPMPEAPPEDEDPFVSEPAARPRLQTREPKITEAEVKASVEFQTPPPATPATPATPAPVQPTIQGRLVKPARTVAPTAPTQETGKTERVCSECNCLITFAVNSYSKQHFGRPLCMKHQGEVRREQREAEYQATLPTPPPVAPKPAMINGRLVKGAKAPAVPTTWVHKSKPHDVYIGRPSKWGNPHPVEQYGREEAIRLYEEWIVQQPELMAALPELKGKRLGCFCGEHTNSRGEHVPARDCHGRILAKLADKT